MKVELQKANRLELPRYFPPGYFDWGFWLLAGLNIGNHAWCGFWIVYQATRGNTIALAVMCAIDALNVMTSVNTIRSVFRHSHEWRTEERPAIIARMEQMDLYVQRMADEFAEFLNSKSEGKNED